MKLGNKTLDLIIAGRFHANGDRGRFGFISKSFLQKFMSKPGFVNAFYVNTANQKLTNEIENNSNAIDIYKVSKKQIAAGSYKNAIKGTEIFELSSNAIILLAIIMVFHFYFSTSLSNYFDISRLRAQGISISKLINAYFLQVFCVITLSFLVGTVSSIFFIRGGVDMILPYIDVNVTYTLPIRDLLIKYIIVFAISFIGVYLSIKKSLKDDYLKYITISE